VLTLTVTDTKGFDDVAAVELLVADTIDARHSCSMHVFGNRLALIDDSGDGGEVANLANSQCAVSLAGPGAVRSGNIVAVTLSVTPSVTYGGNHIIYAAIRNGTGMSTGWQVVGTWSVH